jgi:hypothetical protein
VSKSDNIKRAKLLRQRKRERDKGMKQTDQLEKDQKMLLGNAIELGYEIVDRSVLGRKEKISSLLLEMIYTLLIDAHDEEEVREIVSFGLVAWNCGIIKATLGDEELKKAMKSFKSLESLENKKLLEEYINIKCNKFYQYTDLIVDYRISFEKDGRLNFSVVTGIPNKI